METARQISSVLDASFDPLAGSPLPQSGDTPPRVPSDRSDISHSGEDAPKFIPIAPLPHIDLHAIRKEILGETIISCAPVVRAHNLCYLIFLGELDLPLKEALFRIELEFPSRGEKLRLIEELEIVIGRKALPSSSDRALHQHHGQRLLKTNPTSPLVKEGVLQWTFSWFERHLHLRHTQFSVIPVPTKIHAHVLDHLIKTSTLAKLFDNLCTFGILPHKTPLISEISSVHHKFLEFFKMIISLSPELLELLREWQQETQVSTKALSIQVKSMEGFVVFAQLHALNVTLPAIFKDSPDPNKLLKYLKHMKRLSLAEEIKIALLKKAFSNEPIQEYLQQANMEAITTLLAIPHTQHKLEKGIKEQIRLLCDRYLKAQMVA